MEGIIWMSVNAAVLFVGVCIGQWIGQRLWPPRRTGWVVMDGARTKFRTWQDGWSTWTTDPAEAVYYARRRDAEEAHREDEDAWAIVERALPSPATEG